MKKKTGEYKVFEETFLQLLFLHAPTKKKVIQANNMPYMTKTLRKAIMRRSALKNKFYKSKLSKIRMPLGSKETCVTGYIRGRKESTFIALI